MVPSLRFIFESVGSYEVGTKALTNFRWQFPLCPFPNRTDTFRCIRLARHPVYRVLSLDFADGVSNTMFGLMTYPTSILECIVRRTVLLHRVAGFPNLILL